MGLTLGAKSMQNIGVEYVVIKLWVFVDRIVKFLYGCVCVWMNKSVLNV